MRRMQKIHEFMPRIEVNVESILIIIFLAPININTAYAYIDSDGEETGRGGDVDLTSINEYAHPCDSLHAIQVSQEHEHTASQQSLVAVVETHHDVLTCLLLNYQVLII